MGWRSRLGWSAACWAACVDDGQKYDALADCGRDGSPFVTTESFLVETMQLGVEVRGRSAIVRYVMEKEKKADLAIFDVAGRRMATLVRGVVRAGSNEVVWNAAGAPQGMYFARLRVAGRTLNRTLLVLE